MTRLVLLIVASGCSLRTFEHVPCTEDIECQSAFGPESACADDGFCTTDDGGEETHSGIVINEILAANTRTNTDEVGQFEDWVELYNRTDEFIDLTGWSLSDHVDGSAAWTFPSGTAVPGRGYVLVYCDETPADGPSHATFKLSRDGETVALFGADGSTADTVSFPAQVSDVSWARIPDGSGPFELLDPPTPSAAN